MPMDLGNGGLENLRAVNTWINLIDASMTGSNRTAFKGARITFSGGDARVVSTVDTSALPLQYAETTLRISTTAVEFLQGQIRETGITTNFAIQDKPHIAGTNFFVLREQRGIDGSFNADTSQYNYFLSRDGEFKWMPANVTYANEVQAVSINNADGGSFKLKYENDTTAAIPFGSSAGTVQSALEALPSIGSGNVSVTGSGTSGSPYLVTFIGTLAQLNARTLVIDKTNLTVTPAVFPLVTPAIVAQVKNTSPSMQVNSLDDPTNTNGWVLTNAYGLLVLARDGNFVFSTAGDFTQALPKPISEAPMVFNHKAPQNLSYSRYGATIFDGGTAGYAFTDDASQDALPFRQRAERFQGGLEQATTSVMTLIPELSMAQKTFTALAKSLTVFSQNLDESMGLIK